MGSDWIPTWLSVLALVGYAGVVLVHVHHARALRGPSRWWHAGHLLMALGMIDMFWPSSAGGAPVGETAGVVVFAVATACALGLLAWTAARGGHWQLWVVSVADLAAMVYMFAMMSHSSAALTVLFVSWSVLGGLGWASGDAERILGFHAADAHGADAEAEHTVHGGADLRATLAFMAVGTAYMLLAMQYGMPGHGMPGMTGM